MKQAVTLFIMLFIMKASIFSQAVIARWSFPTGTAADSLPDEFSPENINSFISAIGTSVIDFSKNGFTTKAAQTTQWEDGENLKYWHISLNTSGYKDITISSVQQSGGTNAGPKYFKLQYRLSAGTWMDVNTDTIYNTNDWTTSELSNVLLPNLCDNQPELFIRWLCITDSSSNNTIVQPNGTSKIDDIVVKGDVINHTDILSLVKPWVYSSNGVLYVENNSASFTQEIYSLSGRLISVSEHNSQSEKMLQNGFYIVRIICDKGIYCFKIYVYND